MKKIVVFHHFGGIGGAGLSLMDILASIDRNLYEVTVVCPNNPLGMVELMKGEGIKVVETDHTPINFAHYNGGIKYIFSPRTVTNLLRLLRDIPSVKRLINDLEPEMVIVNSMTLFWIGKVAQRRKCKTVCFHRETYVSGCLGLRTALIKHYLSKYFNKVVFISNYDLKESESVRTQKEIIYDKVHRYKYENLDRHTCREQLNLSNDTRYILYLGGFSRLKGAQTIIEAMQYVKTPNTKLIFVGKIPSDSNSPANKIRRRIGYDTYHEVMTIIKAHNLSDRIVFYPETSRPELFYGAADVIVFPSTQGHQARPIYEAGFARIPIVISDFPQTREFSEHRFNTLTFTPKDAMDLSRKIDECFTDKNLKELLIENNFKLAVDKHDYESMKREINEVLEEL